MCVMELGCVVVEWDNVCHRVGVILSGRLSCT